MKIIDAICTALLTLLAIVTLDGRVLNDLNRDANVGVHIGN